ncbi:amidohydrolase 2 [Pseudovirgaria hyperparasitica]|uniref:6-methylsalicylate decarboxylase n=1 Tax=Pseudovirgaria hyperparasitica TaxID=470096 RepID=A0A6A6VXA7_9PEZI|nr:amidohydrolase 2 [Pseudovirgaria hyperparasitica]KAF2753881.1 amidohydrolase 2 [Pseudovirgaria hyperparasitica]
MSSFSPKIDTHSHYIPPGYREALEQNGHTHPDGMPGVPSWSPEDHLQLMIDANISKSILSISTPGTHLVPGNDALAAKITRSVNSYAAGLKRQYPDKFGYFASLPLPAVNETLKEIAVAFDEGADGVLALTNSHGRYLGDPLFEPVMAELDRRYATVMIHPTTPCIFHNDEPIAAAPLLNHPRPMYEFFFDTARAVINLFLSQTMSRYPNITWIIPHAGGALPPLFSRFTGFSRIVPGGVILNEDDVRKTLLEQCYFDLAGFVFPNSTEGKGQLAGLVEGMAIPAERLLLGTDYCYTPAPAAKMIQARQDVHITKWFNERDIRAVYHDNAERLLNRSVSKRKVKNEKRAGSAVKVAEVLEVDD